MLSMKSIFLVSQNNLSQRIKVSASKRTTHASKQTTHASKQTTRTSPLQEFKCVINK